MSEISKRGEKTAAEEDFMTIYADRAAEDAYDPTTNENVRSLWEKTFEIRYTEF